MQLFIPTIGSKLRLIEDWKFTLHDESRNHGFARRLGITTKCAPYSWSVKPYEPTVVKIAAGTMLVLDRIYIRKGAPDFDSLTFRIIESPDTRLVERLKKDAFGAEPNKRFWAKLTECNTMQVEPV